MRKTLLFLLGCLTALPGLAQETSGTSSPNDFQYPTGGNSIWYTVIDESNHTCQTKAGSDTIIYDDKGVPHLTLVPGNTVTGSIKIPQTVTKDNQQYTVIGIGEYGFTDNTELKEVSIEGSVVTIGEAAFSNCTSLSSVSLPYMLTEITASTFANCSSLTTITIPSNVTKIGQSAFSSSGLTSIDISSVTSLGDYAFRGCKSLSNVTFSSNLTSLPTSVFNGCSNITELNLPASLTQIGAYAFYNCNALINVTSNNPTPPSIGTGSFGSNNNPTLYVPKSGLEAYKKNTLWSSSFKTIKAIPVAAESITLDKNTLTVYAGGQQVMLHATVTPADASDNVIWSVSDPNIATISQEGAVQGKVAGTATITATCGSQQATCQLTVINLKPNSVVINIPTDPIYVGDEVDLTVTVTGGSSSTVTWSSSNTDVATIDSSTGKLRALSPGQTVIYATCDGVTGNRSVTIYEVPAQSVTLDKTEQTVQIGGSFTLTAYVSPDNTTNKTITWTTNNSSVITVDNGTVTAVGVGQATVTATCGTATGECQVTVTPIPVTGITISQTSVDLIIGQSQQLIPNVSPENATDKSVTWSSSNPSVATVTQDGTVSAVAAGSANITATTTDGNFTATCQIKVSEPEPESIVLSMTQVTLKVGNTQQLTADVAVTWSSSDTSVATVSDNGMVTAVGLGKAIITATHNKISATCEVVVEATPVESITLDKTESIVNVGETVMLNATVLPANATDKSVTWSSSDTSIATVSNGTITGIAPGNVTITAKSGDKEAQCNVKVLQPAKSITLNYTDVTINVTELVDLIPTIEPANTTDVVTWSSSNTNVASVSDNGVVRGLGKGSAVITAQCGNAKATCNVTVNPIEAESITLDKTEITLKVSQSEQLTATVLPEKVTGYAITWTSSDEKVATVSSDGIVTAVAVGTATVRATCLSGVYAECKVTVEAIKEGKIVIDYPNLTLRAGQTQQLSLTAESMTIEDAEWESSDIKVATVSEDGLVTAIAVGNATIMATCGTATATCNVTVEITPVERIDLDTYDLKVRIGSTAQIKATVVPETATEKTVTWTSNDEKIATITQDGVVTGVSIGTTTVTASCGNFSIPCLITVEPISAESVTLSQDDVTLDVGMSLQINATVKPDDTTDNTVLWSSDNPQIAIVADGLITGVAPGKTIIRAVCGSVFATCEVTVEQPATSISLNISNVVLDPKETVELIATVEPANTTDTVVWSSSDTEVATVNNGVVTAISEGTAIITAICGDLSATCVVNVSIHEEESIRLNVTSMTLLAAQTQQLIATLPESLKGQTVTWTSSNNKVATVAADGLVTAIAVGETTITATCGDLSATCLVTVETTLPYEVVLDIYDATLYVDDSITLVATVLPETTTFKDVTWSTSNSAIAIVEQDGTVTGISAGIATITATCGSVSGYCVVTVIDESVSTGIVGLTPDSNGYYRVFTISGVNILNTTAVEDLERLEKGFYIINGRKCVVRK